MLMLDSVKVLECVFNGNQLGIKIINGNHDIKETAFISNHGNFRSGGLDLHSALEPYHTSGPATVLVEDYIFVANQGEYTGAIDTYDDSVTLRNSVFMRNTRTSGNGGEAITAFFTKFDMERCVLVGH